MEQNQELKWFAVWINDGERQIIAVSTYDPDYWIQLAQSAGYLVYVSQQVGVA